jgi:hypothetical protein
MPKYALRTRGSFNNSLPKPLIIDTARFDHITAVGNRERRIGILLDQQDRRPTRFQPVDDRKDLLDQYGRESIEGSSSNTSFGRAISARPITNICCWPPDRARLRWCAFRRAPERWNKPDRDQLEFPCPCA